MSDDTPEARDKEQKATEEHVPEGEVIYRAIRQDGDYALCRGRRVPMRVLVPAFLGNSIGGVALVGALAHARHAPK